MHTTLFACLFLFLWPYIGFPVILWLLSRYVKPASLEVVDVRQLTVSIIIPAHNEACNLPSKLETIYRQSCLKQVIQVIVVSDGSTDNTEEAISPYIKNGLLFLDLPRQGKAAILNSVRTKIKGDVVVFSDADTYWEDDTLTKLLRPFENPKVGGAGGVIKGNKLAKNIGFGDYTYRSYETMIRNCENRLGVVVGLDGGLFAIRTVTWLNDIPLNVTDDFYLSTCPVIQKLRLVFVPEAIAFERPLTQAKDQYRRRVRITVRSLTGLWVRRCLFNPFKYRFYALALFSHKLLRRIAPVFGLLLLPIIFILSFDSLVFLTISLSMLFCLVLSILAALDKKSRFPKIIYTLAHITVNSWAVFTGLVLFIMGKRYYFWRPRQD